MYKCISIYVHTNVYIRTAYMQVSIHAGLVPIRNGRYDEEQSRDGSTHKALIKIACIHMHTCTCTLAKQHMCSCLPRN